MACKLKLRRSTEYLFNYLVNRNIVIIYHMDVDFWQEFAGEDNQDLFLEEREQAIKQAQEEKRKIQISVPGILGPHEIQEDMQD